MKFPLKGETADERFNELLGTVTHVSHDQMKTALSDAKHEREQRHVEIEENAKRREVGRKRRAREPGEKA